VWQDYREEKMIERQVCSLRFVSPKGFSPEYRNQYHLYTEMDVLMVFANSSTRLGRWALALALGFVALTALLTMLGPGSRNVFWEDPVRAYLMILAAACGIAAGAASGISIFVKGDRSLLILVILLVSASVLLFAIWDGVELFGVA
jgi:hypothetical protein